MIPRAILRAAAVAVGLTAGVPWALGGEGAGKPPDPATMTLGDFFDLTVRHENLRAFAPYLTAHTIMAGRGCVRLERTDPTEVVWRFRQDAARGYWLVALFRDGSSNPPEASEPLLAHWYAYLVEWCKQPNEDGQ